VREAGEIWVPIHEVFVGAGSSSVGGPAVNGPPARAGNSETR
jgi:hypothetical protein